MKRSSLFSILSLVVLVFGLTSCGTLGKEAASLMPKPTAQELVQHEGKSTVALVWDNIDNEDNEVSDIRPVCTAVWIDQTHILTAAHCIKAVQERLQDRQDKKEANKKECDPLAALFGMCNPDETPKHKVIKLQDMPMHYFQWAESQGVSRDPSAIHLAKVVGWDQPKDLALIEAVGDVMPPHEAVKLADNSPEMTEPVIVVGHPKGLYWTFMTGTVAGNRATLPHLYVSRENEDDPKISRQGPFLQIEAPVYFGNSGGGAFNDRGELVGIASFLLRVPGEGFFVGVPVIREFLTDQNFYPYSTK